MITKPNIHSFDFIQNVCEIMVEFQDDECLSYLVPITGLSDDLSKDARPPLH
jgi:hypothetical protein